MTRLPSLSKLRSEVSGQSGHALPDYYRPYVPMLQRCCLVQGDVIRLIALDFVLRILLARMVDVSFIIHILRMHFHNPAADVPGLGVPGHVIANFETIRHDSSPTIHAPADRNEPFVALPISHFALRKEERYGPLPVTE
jgi:hypothetical protein